MDYICTSMVLEKYWFYLYFYIEICKFAVYLCHNIGTPLVRKKINSCSSGQNGRSAGYFCRSEKLEFVSRSHGYVYWVRDFRQL